MTSRIVSGRIGLGFQVLLMAGILGLIAERPVFGQSSDSNSTGQPGAAGLNGAQRSAGTDPPGGAKPAIAPPNTAANQNQPLAVNPLTGLTTASAANYKPLTGKQRWQLYWKQNYYSVGAYFGPVLTSLVLDQATNSPGAWGGGIGGYGRRLGSRTLTAILQGTFQASMAPLLHEDVRYISSAQTGFKRRALHAVAFSFVTYTSQGHTTLNIANLTSYYAATAVSTTWVPIDVSTGRYILTNGTEQIALSIPVNLLQEFWPEIRHKILRRP